MPKILYIPTGRILEFPARKQSRGPTYTDFDQTGYSSALTPLGFIKHLILAFPPEIVNINNLPDELYEEEFEVIQDE